MQDPIVIVGGGISALLAAGLIRRRRVKNPIVVVEQTAELGGLLRRIDGGKYGCFDCGMHTMTETGIADLDDFLWGLLPEDKWHFFGGHVRDLSGAFFQGRLQHNAHHADLRLMNPMRYRDCVADFFLNLQKPNGHLPRNMGDFATHRFGNRITDEVIAPVIRKTYRKAPDDVDVSAAQLLPLDRVVMFDEPSFRDLMSSSSLRERLAYPEQRHLPINFSSGRGSYYPKDFGIYRVIEALAERLRTQDVQILTSTQLTGMQRQHNRIASVQLRNQSGTSEITNLAQLYWTVGLPPLAKQLGAWPEGVQFDPPLQTVVVNVVLNHPPDMGDLYYFYCLEEPHPSFRITSFSYCPGASRAGGYPLCIELLLDPAAAKDEVSCRALALQELTTFGVMNEQSQVLFSSVLVLPMGFPMLSCRNIDSMSRIRCGIATLELENLSTMGILSKPGLFFQTDLMIDTYKQIMEQN